MAVTIEEALAYIYVQTPQKSIKIIPLEEALGNILAQDIIATHNLPPYDNSAMDGYAVKLQDSGKCVEVTYSIFAGDDFHGELKEHQAIKIMTGARIPVGTQCIVPIEDTKECDKGILLPENLTLSKHIRLAGEDIKKEALLLKKGLQLDAHHIAVLASQGISHIKVYKKPRVALFASGDELKMHFEAVTEYQLYNTNTPSLLARAQELGCEVEFLGTAHDTLEDIHQHIKSALECDFVITSGGVSVGEKDFTKEAFGAFGYEIFFDKVEIKPGKPTTFGKIGNTMILNLPGNPLAAALNFELFGCATIYAMRGATHKFTAPFCATLTTDIDTKTKRRTLIPGFYNGNNFTPSDKYAPGMVAPLASANGFIIIDTTSTNIQKGSSVQVISTKYPLTATEPKNLISF